MGSLCVGDAGGSTVPHQPSLPRTAAEFMDGMPTSHPERGGSRTPSGKKENSEYDKGNEYHDPDDPTLHAGGPLIGPGFLWSPVCHKALLRARDDCLLHPRSTLRRLSFSSRVYGRKRVVNVCEQVLYHAHGCRKKGITTTRQGAQGEALRPRAACFAQVHLSE